MKDKFLPVGTVVMLKDGQVAMVITGYKIKTAQNVIYDYCGCMYPIGNVSEQKGLFNHDQISEIIYMGYENDDFQKYNQQLLAIK